MHARGEVGEAALLDMECLVADLDLVAIAPKELTPGEQIP